MLLFSACGRRRRRRYAAAILAGLFYRKMHACLDLQRCAPLACKPLPTTIVWHDITSLFALLHLLL